MVEVNAKFIIQQLIYGRSDEKLCCVCYTQQNELKDFKQNIYIHGASKSITLYTILQYLTNHEFTSNATSDFQICRKCEESAIECYIFAKRCEASMKAMERCVNYLTQFVDHIDCEKFEDGSERENLIVILPEELIEDVFHSISSDSLFKSEKEELLQEPSVDEQKYNDSDAPEIKLEIVSRTDIECSTKISCKRTNSSQDQFIETRYLKNELHNSIFICDYCSDLFETKSDIVFHMNKVHKMFEICHSKDKSFHSITQGKKKPSRADRCFEHGGVLKPLSKIYNCSMCAESFTNLSLLKEHKYKHPEGTMHICRDCGRMYKTVMALRQHCFVHKIKSKNYLCQICGKAFLKKSMLNAHAKSHDEKIYQCPHCHIRCQTSNKVSYHIKQVHEKEYNHMCDVCGKLFASSGELGIHKDRHVIKSCTLCGKGYKDQKQFKFHMLKHETASVKLKENKYECDYCGCWWKHKWSLVQHIYGKHLHNRPYKCSICKKGFYTKSAQLRHNIVHTKERPEVCTICQRRFVDKRALLFHTRIHTGEKPYECSECGVKFLNASRRLAHIKSKHLEKKEECHICHKKFAWRKALKNHLEKHNKKYENDVHPNQFYLTYLEP